MNSSADGIGAGPVLVHGVRNADLCRAALEAGTTLPWLPEMDLRESPDVSALPPPAAVMHAVVRLTSARHLVHLEETHHEVRRYGWCGIQNGAAVELATRDEGSDDPEWTIACLTMPEWVGRLVARMRRGASASTHLPDPSARMGGAVHGVALPERLMVPTELLLGIDEARASGLHGCIPTLVHTIGAPVLICPSGTRSWHRASEGEAARVLMRLLPALRGRTRLALLDRGHERHNAISWGRFTDGWREFCPQSGGYTLLVRRDPRVLRGRLLLSLGRSADPGGEEGRTMRPARRGADDG